MIIMMPAEQLPATDVMPVASAAPPYVHTPRVVNTTRQLPPAAAAAPAAGASEYDGGNKAAHAIPFDAEEAEPGDIVAIRTLLLLLSRNAVNVDPSPQTT